MYAIDIYSTYIICLYLAQKQLSAEVQYIIPTNHACRIVTHVRYINRACLC